jgi:ATP phosphoribosyltransferase
MVTTDKTVDTAEEPQFFKVRLSVASANKRIIFRSVSEKRARAFITTRFPRGAEAYLESPDGETESYEHERAGENGVDADQWSAFDPATYQPVEEVVAPGQTAWADVEG